MRPRPSRLTALAVLALALAACGTADEGADPTSAPTSDSPRTTAATSSEPADGPTDAFPLTVEHAFGETEVPAEPEHVVTWGWGSTEAALAVGVAPVAVAEQVWTVGEGNLLPWVEQAYDDMGADHPTLLADDFTAPPYEQIVAEQPDLILAPYSGIDQEQYELLSEIAPTIAYPEGPWATPWDQVIEITSAALGRSAAGADVLADLQGWFDDQATSHPEFDGVTIANVWDGDGTISVYTSADSRVEVLTDLGFEVAASVDGLDTDDAPDNFYYELSYEVLDQLDADLVISYHSTQEEADAFLDKPELQAIPAVAAGHVAQVVGNEYVSSVSPPTALSVQWGMPDMIEAMSAALDG